MFNNFKHILIGVLSAVVVIAVGASAYNAFASPSAPTANTADLAQYGNGNGNGGNGNGGQTGGGGVQLTAIPASDLSAEEAAALLFMREEEKLARDVYNQMYALWGQPVFQNIAASEQTHTDEIKLLLDRYGLADPALDPGQFTDPNLQALYNQLIAQGSISVTEALNVGALVEQTDIADLQNRLAQTDNADIQLVYTNLMNASYNHLAAFTGEQGGNGQQGGNGNGNGGGNGQAGQAGQGQVGSGVPQANISGAITVHGVVNSYDGMGISFTADDGQVLYVDTGNMRYSQSIGFAPVSGDGMTVVMFLGDQGTNSAISVTVDATGMTYTFRNETGQPLWVGGNG
ncbi:MAG TPA: DUF2202 domain-containing protein, partial [Anaerolineales bacterium]|nr:DUF2202 domain-containing protein [Anaerolineales bacterium]